MAHKQNIYLLLAEGFEEIEALGTADVLKRLGLTVLLTGLDANPVSGSHGIRVIPDIALSDADFDAAGAVVLPGGLPGAVNLMNSVLLREKLLRANEKGVLAAAICAAPAALEKFGLLHGKTVTGYPGAEKLSGSSTLHFSGEMTERDGSVITGKGPGATFRFAAEIARALGTDDEKIKSVFQGMFIHS